MVIAGAPNPDNDRNYEEYKKRIVDAVEKVDGYPGSMIMFAGKAIYSTVRLTAKNIWNNIKNPRI